MKCPDCQKDYDSSYGHCPYCASSRAVPGVDLSSPNLTSRPKLDMPKLNMWGMPKKSSPRVKEYKRTCRKCRTSWFLPKELAEEKAPAARQIKGAKMMTFGTGTMEGVSRRGQTKVLSLEAQKQRVIDNGRCRSCGSSDYVQTKDW